MGGQQLWLAHCPIPRRAGSMLPHEDERALVASAAEALGYDGTRTKLTAIQERSLAAALAVLRGRWRHHADKWQIGLAVAAYNASQKPLGFFLEHLQRIHAGAQAWKPYQDCIDELNVLLHRRGGAPRGAPPACAHCPTPPVRPMSTCRAPPQLCEIRRPITRASSKRLARREGRRKCPRRKSDRPSSLGS